MSIRNVPTLSTLLGTPAHPCRHLISQSCGSGRSCRCVPVEWGFCSLCDCWCDCWRQTGWSACFCRAPFGMQQNRRFISTKVVTRHEAVPNKELSEWVVHYSIRKPVLCFLLAPENSETPVFAALPVLLRPGWRHTPGDREGAASGAAAGEPDT